MNGLTRFFYRLFGIIRKITLAEMRVRDDFLIRYLNFIPHSIKPNHLTAVRLAMSGLFFIPGRLMNSWIALFLLVIGGLTDIVDGVLARKRDQITTLGCVLDPIADKALALGAIWYLFWQGLISSRILMHIILPELVLFIYVVWYLFDRRVKHPEPNIIARLKFTSYVFALILLVVSLLLGWVTWMNYLGWGLIIFGVILSWISQILYAHDVISDFRSQINIGSKAS